MILVLSNKNKLLKNSALKFVGSINNLLRADIFKARHEASQQSIEEVEPKERRQNDHDGDDAAAASPVERSALRERMIRTSPRE